MYDMPKGLQRAASLRWIFLASASVLTVVTLWLRWYELVNNRSSAPSGFVWGITLVVWIALICLCCAVFILRRILERIDRWGLRIIEALGDQRMEKLADLIEGSNVRSIYRRR